MDDYESQERMGIYEFMAHMTREAAENRFIAEQRQSEYEAQLTDRFMRLRASKPVPASGKTKAGGE